MVGLPTQPPSRSLPIVGVVFFADERRIFRIVYLQAGDPISELDSPQWVTEGIPPGRTAVLKKVPAATNPKFGDRWL